MIVEWVIGVAGVASWIWLVKQFAFRNSFLDKPAPVCIGCQRHFVKPGCPVHSADVKKAA